MRVELMCARSAVLLLLVLSACAPDAERIVMRCEMANEPLRLLEGSMPTAHQLGRVGDALFLSSLDGHQWTGRWHRMGIAAPLGEDLDLGTGALYRPVWTAKDEQLEGFLITDPDGGPAEPGFRYVGWWRLAPPPALPSEERTAIRVNAPETCWDCVGISIGADSKAGPQGVLTVANVGDQPIGVLVTALGSCPEDTLYRPPPPALPQPFGNQWRLHVVSPATAAAQPLTWGVDPCDISVSNPLTVSNPFAFQVGDGTVGVLYRPLGIGRPGHIQYLTARVDSTLISGPILVGGDCEIDSLVSGGHQPRAVRLGETVLFTDGLYQADECSAIRMMNVDGTEPKDTPYQLPCRKDDSRVIFWIELGRLGEYAVLVWSERSSIDTIDVLSTSAWDEAVWMALLSDKGQLASEPVRVTEPESTALAPATRGPTSGPFVDEFRVSLVAEGDLDPVVAWTDGRADGPGVYARTVRCSPVSPGAE